MKFNAYKRIKVNNNKSCHIPSSLPTLSFILHSIISVTFFLNNKTNRPVLVYYQHSVNVLMSRKGKPVKAIKFGIQFKAKKKPPIYTKDCYFLNIAISIFILLIIAQAIIFRNYFNVSSIILYCYIDICDIDYFSDCYRLILVFEGV